MILRRLHDGILEGVEQHEHGRMTGVLAARWVGLDRASPADDEFISVARLHDAGWSRIDRQPPFDATTGLPCDFLNLPRPARLDLYAAAAAEAAAFDPWLAVMTSLHYSNLPGVANETAYLAAEAARRNRLMPLLPPHLADAARQSADLQRLQLLDLLSLWVLLTGPDHAEPPPAWLSAAHWPLADPARPWRARWLDATTATLYPWPFRGGDLKLAVATRRWSEAPWADEAAWRQADARAQSGILQFVLRAERRAASSAT